MAKSTKGKDYYLDEKIGDTGIAEVKNPLYLSNNYNAFETTPQKINIGEYFKSDSKYDSGLGDVNEAITQGLTVDDLRQKAQSGWDMAANALANNLVIAGTTAISGTLGIADGIFEALANQDASKLWDNSVNNAMTDIQNKAKDVMPVYRGNAYNNDSLFGKMGSGVFWADLVENLGFTEGMIIPGMGVARALSSAPAWLRAASASFTSSISEASSEAINARNDEVSNKQSMAIQRYNEMYQNADDSQKDYLKDELDNTLNNIDEDSRRAGNFVFGSNIALLSLTNSIEFGNLFSRGFGTAKRLKGALTRTGETYAASAPGIYAAKAAGKKLVDAFSEGMEEVSQDAISNTPLNYTDYNTFNESLFNPDKRELVGNLVQAFGETYSNTLKDPQTAEDFAAGFLIGALGVPMLKKSGFPLTIENSIAGEIGRAYKEADYQNNLADQINERLSNDKIFNSYYNGLVRNLTIQDNKEAAINNNDAFNYKNSETAQLISDLQMFDDAGDINHFKDLVNNSIDTSDDGIKGLIESTTKDGEGPFVSNGNEMSVDDVRYLLNKKKEELSNRIDSYVKTKESLESTYPDIDKDTLNNAVFLKEQLNDHSKRLLDLINEISPKISSLSDLESKSANNDALSTNDFLKQWNTNPLYRTAIFDALENNKSKLPFDERKQLAEKLVDLEKVQKNMLTLDKSLEDILTNPSKSKSSIDKIKDKVVNRDKNKKTRVLKDSLNSAATLNDFKNILNNIPNESDKDSLLTELENEGNRHVKNYRETNQYNTEVKTAIGELNEDPEVKKDALTLFNNHYFNSENLQEAANPDSVHINDNTTFEKEENDNVEEANNRFQKARYAIQRAMSKVNNSNSFKDRFSDTYKRPADKTDDPDKTVEKESTGDSKTSKVPTVKPKKETKVNINTPVGNITKEQMSEDNNNNFDTLPSSEEQKEFYFPIIPELYKDAVALKDYRPFKTVVQEREGLDFSAIYDYLDSAQAFKYINDGNLKEGSTIGFMIDPSFDNKTIFMIDKSNNHVVGSLPLANNIVSRFSGLLQLIDNIYKEFNSRNNKESKDKFISTRVTKVSKMMVGKVPFSNQERNLKDISGIDPDTSIFGIIKSGTLVTNKNIGIDKVNISNISDKEGRLYLLIPNVAGRYTPVAIRVKHLNETEFNINDESIKGTPIGSSIVKNIEALSKVDSQESLDAIWSQLGSDIYTYELMPQWFSNNEGKGILFNKTKVYFADKKGINIGGLDVEPEAMEIAGLGDGSTYRDTEEVKRNLISVLNQFNFPIQVSSGKINKGAYNKSLINSGILTSDMEEATIKGNWFTTDYIKDESIVSAVNPPSRIPKQDRGAETSTLNTGSVSTGTPILLKSDNNTYFVNLRDKIIRDKDGNIISNNQLIIDLALAQEQYGNFTEGITMSDNKILIDNRILDRSTQTYITGNEASKIKEKILNRVEDNKKLIDKSESAITNLVQQMRSNIDFGNSTSQYYYIKEEDGKYYPYETSFNIIGSNSVNTTLTPNDLDNIRAKLSKYADSTSGLRWYNSFLSKLENTYAVDLSIYRNNPSIQARNEIIDKMKEAKLNPERTKGASVETIVNQFFTGNNNIARPKDISETAYSRLINLLNNVKVNIENSGERFLSTNAIVYYKHPSGRRIAGKADILSIDKYGNLRIYNVNADNEVKDHFTAKSSWQRMNQKRYASIQLSLFKDIFESKYNVPISKMATMLFTTQYNKKSHTIDNITELSGVELEYIPNSEIASTSSIKTIPVVTTVTKTTTVSKKKEEPVITLPSGIDSPIFNSSLEINTPINLVLPENKINIEGIENLVGYYDLNGKLYKAYMIPLVKIGDNQLYFVKESHLTTNNGTSPLHVALSDFYVIFPNGKAFKAIAQAPTSGDKALLEGEAYMMLKSKMEAVPDKVNKNSSEKTILFNPETATKIVDTSKKDTPSTGAFGTISKEAMVNNSDPYYEDEFTLRKVEEGETSVWNQEKELSWINKVLPQLSEKERINIVKGLIEVGRNGTLAWGMFNKNMLTLSDIAAEGTAYHEAFHFVFNSILNSEERNQLYDEAKSLYGNLSNIQLEEELAEGFREYMMSKDSKNLGQKILNFFKELFDKVTNWKYVLPSITSYYRMIDEGKYRNSDIKTLEELKTEEDNKTEWSSIKQDITNTLVSKGWTEEKFNSISEREKDQLLRCYGF